MTSKTTPGRRGRPRRASADRAIVEATLGLLAERGFQAATVDAIAERAGVGRHTIYRRWPSKEDLIVDAIGGLTIDLVPAATSPDLCELLVEHARRLESVLDDPRISRLLPGLIGELDRNPQLAAAWADRVVRPGRRAIVDLLEGAIAAGRLRPGTDPNVVADLVLGPLLIRHVIGLGPGQTEDGPAALVHAIWNGIAPPDIP